MRARAPFRVDACVVLPDHLHFLWTVPQSGYVNPPNAVVDSQLWDFEEVGRPAVDCPQGYSPSGFRIQKSSKLKVYRCEKFEFHDTSTQERNNQKKIICVMDTVDDNFCQSGF
jgi:REP element-mobilizing transposase RayT